VEDSHCGTLEDGKVRKKRLRAWAKKSGEKFLIFEIVVPVRMPSGGEVRRKERPIEKGPVGHASTRLTTR
jgi:hypothetical protein